MRTRSPRCVLRIEDGGSAAATAVPRAPSPRVPRRSVRTAGVRTPSARGAGDVVERIDCASGDPEAWERAIRSARRRASLRRSAIVMQLAGRPAPAPGQRRGVSALTDKDVGDLTFIARHADAVTLRPVACAADVAEIAARLVVLGRPDFDVVLEADGDVEVATLRWGPAPFRTHGASSDGLRRAPARA